MTGRKSILTDVQVAEMQEKYQKRKELLREAANYTIQALATEYNVALSTAHIAVLGYSDRKKPDKE